MQDPLKQGLKQSRSEALKKSFFIIRMQDPLKQGLKLTCKEDQLTTIKNSNARSTKTRIETSPPRHPDKGRVYIRMQDPLKQGLKLFSPDSPKFGPSRFECKIH